LGEPPGVRAATSPVRDLREGHQWTFAQSVKNDAIYALICSVLFVLRPLPERVLVAAGRFLGRVAYGALRRERQIARTNVARVLGCEGRAVARRAFVQLGGHLGEFVAQLAPGARATPLRFAEGSLELIRDALAEGRGVLFASAHLGPWERVAVSLVQAGLPLATVAREAYDPRLTALYERVRVPHGVRAIYRGHPGAGARMLRTLRGGGLLGMPMDLRTRAPSEMLPFLGADAPTPTGPARLAHRTGAAIVVGTAAIEGGEVILSATRIPRGSDELATTRHINDELSRRILAFPEGWVWMHPRWG
jgi:KDO2-lipid IV(A) lauroyltransferase